MQLSNSDLNVFPKFLLLRDLIGFTAHLY